MNDDKIKSTQKISSIPLNKTQKRLYSASSDPTFEHETYEAMQQYLTDPTSYIGQLLYCKKNDKHYRIAKGDNNQKILKEIVGEMTADNITYSNEELPDVSNVKSALDTIKTQVAEGGLLKIVNTLDEADAIPNLRDGMICYVEEEKIFFSREDGEWKTFKGDTGGVAIGTLKSSLDGETLSIAVGETILVDLYFATPNLGDGTLYVKAKNKEIMKEKIRPGDSSITLKLEKGEQTVQIYVRDRAGVLTNVVQFTVQCGGLDLITDFDWAIDYSVGDSILFDYTINSVSKDPIITHFIIDKKEYTHESVIGYNEYYFPELSAGHHNVEVYATSGKLESSKITETLSIMNSGDLYVSSLYNEIEAEEGDQIIINYRISMKDEKEFKVEYLINQQSHKKGIGLNGNNVFPISELTKGDHTFTIKVTTKDGSSSAQTDITIKIKESSYQLQQPITQGLIAWFDAYNLSNQDENRNIWKDKSGKNLTATLHNFNYNTNGWINNGLKMNGSAYAKLNIKPFENDARSGLTIDVEFETEDIGNENARVLDCVTQTSSNVGCYIDTNEARITSIKHKVKSPFAQKEKTRATYVIDRRYKLMKVYINAVLSEVAPLDDQGTGNDKNLESVEHTEYMYLNSRLGTSHFGDCTVYSVRVYNRPLTSDEILKNHIADIRDKNEQKKKWDFNYKNTIPTMYFEGNVDEMTKDQKVELKIQYISTNEQLYGRSFELSKCIVNWQGTSSLAYDVKNYKIRLRDEEGAKYKHALREGMIEESTFVLKADYMESSHANNTGLAKIVNRYLYSKPLPPQEENPNKKIVSAIDGFPIKLFINGDLAGVFNFNLDKGNNKSFGLSDKNENCISYEVRANTDTTAGAFVKWKGEQNGEEELAYLKDSFEQRFPDEEDEGKANYGYLTHLKRLVDWVSDASDDEFRAHFDEYLDREYTFKYYLFVLTMGMVDNLGKNMMINTWDGNKWYPCFYDLDFKITY